MAPLASDPEQEFFPLSDDEIKFLRERRLPETLSAGEIDPAVSHAAGLLGQTGVSTRSASTGSSTPADAPRTVARIRPLAVNFPAAGGATRSPARADSLFRVVDFADGRGYCIVAADRRLPDPVVCFVPHGSFPDTGPDGGNLQNPGLAMMMEALGVYAARSIDERREWNDSISAGLLARTGAASLDAIRIPDPDTVPDTRLLAEPYIPTWQFNRRLGPLLPVEWGQGKPFNLTVVDSTQWKSTPVGCVALSTAQIMAYWKHPVRFHGLASDSIDWNELRRWSGATWNRPDGYGTWDGPMSEAPVETQRLVADILWHIGSEIDMNYSASNSTAYTYKAVDLLARNGFSKGRSTGYSDRLVVESLEAGRPLLIDGASHRSEYGSYANAHNWTIDGFMEERWHDIYVVVGHIREIERFRWYLHNNFGWGGTDNGWYAAGVFDANNNPDMPSGVQSSTPETRAEWEGDHYNYQFMQTLYVDIYK
jgi:hypothetical protein